MGSLGKTLSSAFKPKQQQPLAPQIGIAPREVGGANAIGIQGFNDKQGSPLLGGAGGGIPTIGNRYQQDYGQPSQGMGQQLFESFQKGVGATGFQPVQFQDQSYYDSVKTSMMDDLKKEFFGTGGRIGGRFEGALNQESAAGRLGSPVAQALLQETVTQPFADASTKIGQQVFQQQQQDRMNVAQMNQQFNASYNDLASRAAMAERGLLSQEQVAQLDADLRGYEARLEYQGTAGKTSADIQRALMEDARRGQELSIDYLRTPIKYAPDTAGVASQLSQGFGGGPIQAPTTPYASTAGYSQGAPIQRGQFYGEVRQGGNGSTYVWQGATQGWVKR